MVLRVRPTPSRLITDIRYPPVDSTSLQGRLERPTKQEVTFMLLTRGGQHRCPCIGLYGCKASIMNRARWLEPILQGTTPFHCFVEFILLGHVCFSRRLSSPPNPYICSSIKNHTLNRVAGIGIGKDILHTLCDALELVYPPSRKLQRGAFFWSVEARV